jgi:hypothetical protein
MTTRARDFKFAGAIVQRLYLVMVVITRKFFSAHYAWFSRGRSQITKLKIDEDTEETVTAKVILKRIRCICSLPAKFDAVLINY